MTNSSSNMSKLVEVLTRLTANGQRFETAVDGLSLFCRDTPSDALTGAYWPSVCIIAQGRKQVWLGEQTFVYDSKHFLLSGLHLPVVAQVIEASETKPYLGMTLKLDYAEITQLMAQCELGQIPNQKSDVGMFTGRLDESLTDAFYRLALLLEQEEDIAVLAPMLRREIFYRVLMSEQGVKLRQLAALGSSSQQVAKAMNWLKDNFALPLKVSELAAKVNMGVSTFHHHFRVMTTMSPIQYQKQLRLQEARRLMLSDNMDAANAAFQVGYESASQFSREYSRIFGLPPLKDVIALRQQLAS